MRSCPLESQAPDGSSVDAPGTDGGLRKSELPDGYQLVRSWLLDTAQDLAHLRASLKTELAQGIAPEPDLARVAHAMVLVASELATNALKHGIPPTIVRLLRRSDMFLLDVADHDLSTRPRLAEARAPGEGGFGLQIARRIAFEVSWYTTDVTKHVWAIFPVREAPQAPVH